MNRLNNDFSSFAPPQEDPFNIDEIEKLNEERLRKLEEKNVKTRARNEKDILANFMAAGVDEVH